MSALPCELLHIATYGGDTLLLYINTHRVLQIMPGKDTTLLSFHGTERTSPCKNVSHRYQIIIIKIQRSPRSSRFLLIIILTVIFVNNVIFVIVVSFNFVLIICYSLIYPINIKTSNPFVNNQLTCSSLYVTHSIFLQHSKCSYNHININYIINYQ